MNRIEIFIQKIFGAFCGMRFIKLKSVANSSDTFEEVIEETIKQLEEIQRKQDSVMVELCDLVENQKGIEDARTQIKDL